MEYRNIGPVRLHAMDVNNYPVQHELAGEARVWVLSTVRPRRANERCYVFIPIPVSEEMFAGATLCAFENGLYSLAYLHEHPEVSEL